MKKKITNKDFIEKAIKVHGNKYDYSLLKYYNAKTKVKIICSVHNVFEQTPTNHLTGKGCKKCGRINAGHKIKLTNKDFIEKAIKVHGDKYDYSSMTYKGTKIPIDIFCSKHGIFKQVPNYHLSGCGCPNCYKEIIVKNTQEFVEKSNIKHENKYDYSKTCYINRSTKIIITCPKHGEFKQTPGNHLYGFGCSKCSSNFSKGHRKLYNLCREIFPNRKIIIEQPIRAQNKLYYADIFIESLKLVVEYNGDYWHCNPEKYKADYFHKKKQMYAKDIWKYDEQKQKNIESLGYKIITIWENDFKNNKDKINILLKELKKV